MSHICAKCFEIFPKEQSKQVKAHFLFDCAVCKKEVNPETTSYAFVEGAKEVALFWTNPEWVEWYNGLRPRVQWVVRSYPPTRVYGYKGKVVQIMGYEQKTFTSYKNGKESTTYGEVLIAIHIKAGASSSKIGDVKPEALTPIDVPRGMEVRFDEKCEECGGAKMVAVKVPRKLRGKIKGKAYKPCSKCSPENPNKGKK